MLATIIGLVNLIALWALMSGLFKPLLIIFGLISALLAIWIMRRMENIDGERFIFNLSPWRLVVYLFWLLKEIAVSAISVTKILLKPKLTFNQKLFSIPVTQKSDIGLTALANSITLTPGTITVETEAGYFLIHALNHDDDDFDALADMGRRVSLLEKQGKEE